MKRKHFLLTYCQPSTFVPGGDQAKAQLVLLLNADTIAEAWVHLDCEFGMIDARLAFVYWYVVNGGREKGEFCDTPEKFAAVKDCEKLV
jgi:hypothetical protein